MSVGFNSKDSKLRNVRPLKNAVAASEDDPQVNRCGVEPIGHLLQLHSRFEDLFTPASQSGGMRWDINMELNCLCGNGTQNHLGLVLSCNDVHFATKVHTRWNALDEIYRNL